MDAREIVRLPEVHLGFAAQTDRGLVVPVVRDAHAPYGRVADRGVRPADRGGPGRARLTPAELTGGTFTLNNYGVFGVDGSTPIINHPEAAMLGVGRIVAQAMGARGRAGGPAGRAALAHLRPPGVRRRHGGRLPAVSWRTAWSSPRCCCARCDGG